LRWNKNRDSEGAAGATAAAVTERQAKPALLKQPARETVSCTVLFEISVLHGLLVNKPPKKNPNPKTDSQCGQEYMTSFLIIPITSLRTGRESGVDAAFWFRVTGFLQ